METRHGGRVGLGRWSLHLSGRPSYLFFLSVTAASVPQGLPVCLLGGRQTLTLNPSVAGSLSLPRGSEWGRGHAGDLGSASGSSLQACDAQLSGKTCLEGMGSPFPWGRSCERGLTCTQEAEGRFNSKFWSSLSLHPPVGWRWCGRCRGGSGHFAAVVGCGPFLWPLLLSPGKPPAGLRTPPSLGLAWPLGAEVGRAVLPVVSARHCA